MILNKKHFVLPGMALLAMVFVACNDDDPTEVYVGNMAKYQKAYITTGVSSPNGTALKGSYTAAELKLTDEGKLIFDEGGNLAPSGGGSFNTDIYFRTTYAVKKAISGTVALIPDAEEFVNRYNAEHQTACELLQEKYYTIENAHATIDAGSKDAVIRVLIDTDLDWDLGEYLLPLGMTLDNGAAIDLSEDRRTLCLKYSITKAPAVYPAEGRILTSDDFDIELVSGSADTHPENAFDSDRNTSWDCPSGTCDVVVTFKEPHYVSRICVVDNTYVYYTWMSYEDTPDTYFGGSYTWGEENGVSELNPASTLKYDASRKIKRVRLRNYYGMLADAYFFVYD